MEVLFLMIFCIYQATSIFYNSAQNPCIFFSLKMVQNLYIC